MLKIFGMLIPDIWVIIIIEIICALGFIVGWFWYNKNRFIVYITEPYLNTYRIKKKLKITLKSVDFKWKNFGYKVNFNYAIADEKNKPILYYNYLKAEPIKPLIGIKIKEDSATFKVAMDGKVMQHLASRRLEKWYTYIIIALVFVVLIVAVYSIYTMQQNNADILRITRRMLNITLANNNGIVIP